MTSSPTKWPKRLPEMTPEQIAIRDDYMQWFYAEVYTRRFGWVQRFNHTYAARSFVPGLRTLDLGAGLGEHLEFEDGRAGDYFALELRPEMAKEIEARYPYVTTLTGDVEVGLQLPDGRFDRVLAIHVLEHLPNLPAALEEISRLMTRGAVLSVVLPCEGGLAYTLGRRLTTQRWFERRYGVSFDPFIKSEHVNVVSEIVEELDRCFVREQSSWFPSRLPTVHTNICSGFTYRKAVSVES